MTLQQRGIVYGCYVKWQNYALSRQRAGFAEQVSPATEGSKSWAEYTRWDADRAEATWLKAFDHEEEPLRLELGFDSTLELYDAAGICEQGEIELI